MQLRNAHIPSSKTKKKLDPSPPPSKKERRKTQKNKKKKKEKRGSSKFGNLTEEFDFPSHDHQKNPTPITIIIIINYDNNKKDRCEIYLRDSSHDR
jgi:hypothetical protein